MAKKTQHRPHSALTGRLFGSFASKTAGGAAGHPVGVLTQHRPHGALTGGRFGVFSGKTPEAPTGHPVGVLTQYRPHGALAGGRFGSFADKGGASTYSLVAEYGTYTITGSDALRDLLLSAESGVYAITGNDATLTYTQPGVYSLTAEVGAYSLTGQDAALTYTPLNAYSLTAEPGSYTVTSQETTLRLSRLAAESGTYSLLGFPAVLVYSGAAVAVNPLAVTPGGGGYGNDPRKWPRRLIDSATLTRSRPAAQQPRAQARNVADDDEPRRVDDLELVQDLLMALVACDALD